MGLQNSLPDEDLRKRPMTFEDGEPRRHAISLALMRSCIAAAPALLVDWDGCLTFGEELMPGAAAFLRRYEDRVAIVSNNTTHLPEDFLLTLRAQGVQLIPERVVLAGSEAIHQALEVAPNGQALLLGNARLQSLARSAGLEPQSAVPEVVILLRDTEFSYERLQRAVNALSAGASLIVGNPDLQHPGAGGIVVPETGALLAALAAVIDLRRVEYRVIGKPNPTLFHRACAALGVAPQRAIMIGDNAATDGAGARALGMKAILMEQGSGLSWKALL
jgi:HAD superfamily hydrolase (TIGR01450 family)